MRARRTRSFVSGGVGLALFLATGASLSAQAAPTMDLPEDSIPVAPELSPGGAFLRSLAIPGWGQAATGSYSRASFYFLTESASAFMLFKTIRQLNSARDRLDFWTVVAEREAAALGIVDADSLAAAIEEHPRVAEMTALEEARSQQREDWIAFGLFMLLLGGADAFVSAHLRDFPDPVQVSALPAQEGELPRMEVRFRLPWETVRGLGKRVTGAPEAQRE